MRKDKKDVIVLFTTIVAVVSIVVAVNVMIKSDRVRRAFENEMAFRLDSEERVNKLRNENINLATQLKDKELAIQKQKGSLDTLQQDLEKTKEALAQTEKELQTMTLLKEKLEENLKVELSKQVQ